MAEPPENSFQPRDRAQWRAWLQAHHADSEGVWLITYKKGVDLPTVSYDDAVEEALCFGWIDSKPARLDAQRTMLWYSPRRPKSVWAKTNKIRVEKLVAAGLMTPAGMAKIEAAKADGSWSKLDGLEDLEVPPDLAQALAAQPPASDHFANFPPSIRQNILFWIQDAKRPETRARRILETATKAAQNQRALEWKPREQRTEREAE